MQKSNTTIRNWGEYSVLYEYDPKVKLKILVVEPHKTLSMQKHQHRAEYWFVAEGIASIYTIDDNTQERTLFAHYPEHQQCWIAKDVWHQLANEQDTVLKIIEIQYGDQCVEEDIERKPQT